MISKKKEYIINNHKQSAYIPPHEDVHEDVQADIEKNNQDIQETEIWDGEDGYCEYIDPYWM